MTARDRGHVEEIINHLKRVENDYRINLTEEMEWLRGLAKEEPKYKHGDVLYNNNNGSKIEIIDIVADQYKFECGDEYPHYEFFGYIESNYSKEPVSEDLEEAAKHYLYSNILYDDIFVGKPTDKDCIEMFKAGAKWQKRQMMKGALDGKMVDGDEPTLVIPSLPITTRHLDDGDKVKVIILKEE